VHGAPKRGQHSGALQPRRLISTTAGLVVSVSCWPGPSAAVTAQVQHQHCRKSHGHTAGVVRPRVGHAVDARRAGGRSARREVAAQHVGAEAGAAFAEVAPQSHAVGFAPCLGVAGLEGLRTTQHGGVSVLVLRHAVRGWRVSAQLPTPPRVPAWFPEQPAEHRIVMLAPARDDRAARPPQAQSTHTLRCYRCSARALGCCPMCAPWLRRCRMQRPPKAAHRTRR